MKKLLIIVLIINLSSFLRSAVIKSDFLINDDTTGGCKQEKPTIAMNENGDYVVVWKDYRDGITNIYAQRYNKFHILQGGNFKVNDLSGEIPPPAVAINEKGDFVIVWHCSSGLYGNNDVYGQLYDSSGRRRGNNFKINDEDTEVGSWDFPFVPVKSPISVDMNNRGDFVVVWEDRREEKENVVSWGVCGQLYNSLGEPQGNNFRIGIMDSRHPQVIIDEKGEFVVFWTYEWHNYIYGQRYNSSGEPWGEKIEIKTEVGEGIDRFLVVNNENGDYLVVYRGMIVFGGVWENIYLHLYNKSNILLGGPFKIDNDPPKYYLRSLSVSNINSEGHYAILWRGENVERDEEKAYVFTSNLFGIPIRLSHSSKQYPRCIAMDKEKNLIVVGEDYQEEKKVISIGKFMIK